MKKWLCLLVTAVLLLSITACKKQTVSHATGNTESTESTESTTENTQNQTTGHTYTLKDSSNEPGMKLLVITDNSTKETIQTLRLGECEWFIPEPIYTDITFDGNKDILVPFQRTASGAFFAGYIWVGEAGQYVYAPTLENIPNIALDMENQLLLSSRAASQITSYGMHRYNGDTRDFEGVRSLYWEPGENGMIAVEHQCVDGKETEVNRFSAIIDDGLLAYYAADPVWDLDSDKWRNWVYTP